MVTATYIALIPKGLEDVATDLIAQKLDVRNFDTPQTWLNAKDNAGGSTNTVPSDAQISSQIRVSQQARKDKAGRRPPSAQGKRQRRDGQIITPAEVVPPSIMDQHKYQSLKRPLQDERQTQENDPVIGTVKIESGAEFAMGYHYYRTQSTSMHIEIIRSHPGLWEGLAWRTFDLPQTPEAARAVSSTRGMGCGPLMALVTTTSSPLLSFTQTKHEALQSLRNSSLSSPHYVHEFQRALVTWYHHASTVWKDSKDIERQKNLKEKMKGLRPFAYRISIVRENTKDYSYPRQELLESIDDENDGVFTLANLLVPIQKLSGRNIFLSIDDELSDVTQQDYKPIVEKEDEGVDHDLRWRVDLKQFDFEVVFAVHANGHVTVAISLRPYQLLGTKCFSSSSRLPPDVLEPHLAIGSDAKTDMVRLRPSTANLLIHMAQLQPGDIVLDPCAGMGTIPLEASFQTHIVGFGGDVYLPNTLVSSYSHQIRQFQDTTTCKGVGEMMQWDAALLPFRDGFVDAIISDLPFGQKCLSAIELKNFLPLMLSECARVLTPTTGRMVLLCGGGSHMTVMDTIHLLKEFWQQPCRAVRPVNISGILACILVIDRSSIPYIFDQECMNKNSESHTGSGSTFYPISNHRARVRKMTSKRRQRNADKSLSRS